MSIDLEAWTRRVRMQHLRTVLAVAETTSLARAADRLGLTQPAVTKILHEVESDLGVALFERTSRGTHSTPNGRLLADHIKLVFTQLDQAAQALHDSREGLRGRVTVGALIAGTASLLPRAVAHLQESRPGVRITIVEGTYDYLTPLLRQGTLDLIVGRLPKHEYREGVLVESLYEERIALVVRAGHPATRLRKPDLQALARWPWILPLAGTTLRQLIETAFHDARLDLPETRCESVSVVFNRRMILETDCICAFPQGVVQLELDNGMFEQIPVSSLPAFGPVGICRRKSGGVSRAAEALLQALRDTATTKP
jgi:DNA-binding transcriptional LysR family regulator